VPSLRTLYWRPEEVVLTPASPRWLAVHHEPGQTFNDFRALRPNRPTSARHVIYLQRLGEFAPERSSFIAKLRDFAAVFFAMEVRVLPAVRISASFTTRRNPHTSTLQILTGDVLNFLRSRVPSDAFCILAITMTLPGLASSLIMRVLS
jgi:archaemetzincin